MQSYILEREEGERKLERGKRGGGALLWHIPLMFEDKLINNDFE